MALSPRLISDAKKLRPRAVAAVLESEYARVYRMAYGLSGRADVGRSIARFVMARAVRVMPKWDPASGPEHWFHRYTVLMSRRSRYRSDGKQDLLLDHAESVDAPYRAFISALRGLPVQQQEAFILNQGERFSTRDSARAMDCSMEAAFNHLQAANDAMKAVCGGELEALSKRMGEAYQRLSPDEAMVVPSVKRLVVRHVWPRKVWRFVVFLVQLAVMGGVIWGAWILWNVVRI
jgi:DNA-directed RNA polymerase specialized sigma24 family protein